MNGKKIGGWMVYDGISAKVFSPRGLVPIVFEKNFFTLGADLLVFLTICLSLNPINEYGELNK